MVDKDEKQEIGGRNQRSLKNLLINPKMQLSFIGYFAFISLQTLVYLFLSSIQKGKGLMEVTQSMGLPSDHALNLEIERLDRLMAIEFSGIMVMYVLFFFGGLYLSHRVAGPIYKLRKHLSDCREKGVLKPLTFRNGDYFQEVADEFNRFINWQVKEKSTQHKE